MTSKHNKKPRKQSELLSRGIKNLAAGIAQLKSMIQELQPYKSEASQQRPPYSINSSHPSIHLSGDHEDAMSREASCRFF